MKSSTVLIVLALAANPAWAHAFLDHAEPGAGAELKTAPGQIALSFTEKLVPSFSGLSVTDAQGRDMEATPARIAGTEISAGLKPLSQGAYHVAWHAVSVDGHRTQGAYSFQVKP